MTTSGYNYEDIDGNGTLSFQISKGKKNLQITLKVHSLSVTLSYTGF